MREMAIWACTVLLIYVLLSVPITPSFFSRLVAKNLLSIKDTLLAALSIGAITKPCWNFPEASFAEVLFKIGLHI